MKNITATEFAKLIDDSSVFTDGGNYTVCEGQHYYALEGFATEGFTEFYTVQEYCVKDKDNYVFFINDFKIDEFDLVSIMLFDNPSEAATYYGQQITMRAVNRLISGI